MLTEAKLSNQIIKQLKLRGYFAYKTSDRFQIGLPDIYYSGGNWIETKIIKCKTSFSPMLLLRPEQKIWAERLSNKDHSWILIIGVKFPEKMLYYSTKYWCMVNKVFYGDCRAELNTCLPIKTNL